MLNHCNGNNTVIIIIIIIIYLFYCYYIGWSHLTYRFVDLVFDVRDVILQSRNDAHDLLALFL